MSSQTSKFHTEKSSLIVEFIRCTFTSTPHLLLLVIRRIVPCNLMHWGKNSWQKPQRQSLHEELSKIKQRAGGWMALWGIQGSQSPTFRLLLAKEWACCTTWSNCQSWRQLPLVSFGALEGDFSQNIKNLHVEVDKFWNYKRHSLASLGCLLQAAPLFFLLVSHWGFQGIWVNCNV